jgi:hypothetical protein
MNLRVFRFPDTFDLEEKIRQEIKKPPQTKLEAATLGNTQLTFVSAINSCFMSTLHSRYKYGSYQQSDTTDYLRTT